MESNQSVMNCVLPKIESLIKCLFYFSVPEGSIIGKLFVWSFRLTLVGLLSYGCYKVYKWTYPVIFKLA